jgi:hypothetical protein
VFVQTLSLSPLIPHTVPSFLTLTDTGKEGIGSAAQPDASDLVEEAETCWRWQDGLGPP